MDGIPPQIASARKRLAHGRAEEQPSPRTDPREHNNGHDKDWLRHPRYTQQ